MTNLPIKLHNAGQYNEALNKINEVVACYPNDPIANFLRSQINYALRNYNEALKDVNTAILVVDDQWKLYAWRAYLYLKIGNSSNIEKIYQDLQSILALEHSSKYGYSNHIKKISQGYYNKYIWFVIFDKSIPSTMKASVYKYLMKAVNSQSRQNKIAYTLPIISSYIQFIYSLDEKDSFFKEQNKTKAEILSKYQNITPGQYATIIKGILFVASGDIDKVITPDSYTHIRAHEPPAPGGLRGGG